MPIITEPEGAGKGGELRVSSGSLLAIAAVLACTGCFGLGFLAGKEAGGGDIIIQEPSVSAPTEEVSSVPKSSQLASPSAALTSPPPATSPGGQYVASKSGSKYHLPWCPGAKQMKEENKIYFSSKEEAEAAGYAPAANCKGI